MLFAFFTFSQGGHVETLECLASKGRADLAATDHRGVTPLLAACRRGQTLAVQWLLAHEAVAWDAADVSGTTPFMAACARGDLALVRRQRR